jgi:hypothetical protein
MVDRLRLRLDGVRLVSELADGAAPTTSRWHRGCAERLLARERRQQLALGLERLIAAAEQPRPALSAAIPPQRRQVREARETLSAIIRALRSADPVAAQGVAMVVRLLADGAGPAYSPAPEGALAELAEDALGTLAATSHARDLAART